MSDRHEPRAEDPLDGVPRAQAGPQGRLDGGEVAGDRRGRPSGPTRGWRARRKRLVSWPVSMPTGQAVAQRPSTAQVSRRVVGEGGLERGEEPGVGLRALQARHLAAHDDPLPGREGELAAGALRLAEPALDALVDLLLDAGQGLEVRQVAVGSALRITPGFSRPSGSTSAFSRFMTALASGPHSASTKGAMLRPVPCSALRAPSYFFTTSSTTSSMKRRVAVDRLLVVEGLRDDEVEVPVLGVAEEDGLVVAVLAEERVRSTAASASELDGEGDVLDDDGRALFRTAPTDGKIPERIFHRSACSTGRG